MRVSVAAQPRPDRIIQFAHGDTGPVLVRQSEKATALVVGTPSQNPLLVHTTALAQA